MGCTFKKKANRLQQNDARSIEFRLQYREVVSDHCFPCDLYSDGCSVGGDVGVLASISIVFLRHSRLLSAPDQCRLHLLVVTICVKYTLLSLGTVHGLRLCVPSRCHFVLQCCVEGFARGFLPNFWVSPLRLPNRHQINPTPRTVAFLFYHVLSPFICPYIQQVSHTTLAFLSCLFDLNYPTNPTPPHPALLSCPIPIPHYNHHFSSRP